jgi:hypothetical protein
LFDANVVDENSRGDEMIRSCHQDYDPTKDDGSITKSTCATKAFEFCVKEKRGHWAPEKCIEVIENCFASKDEFESRFKADINRLLIDYMIKVRALETKQPPTQGETASGLKWSKPDPQNPFPDIKDKYLHLPDASVAFFECIEVKREAEWVDISNWIHNIHNRAQEGNVKADGINVILRFFTDKRKARATVASVQPFIGRDHKNEVNSVKSKITPFARKEEFVMSVIEKILAPTGSSEDSGFFPHYLPIERRHVHTWVSQVLDPSSVWLVYPFDMMQTRANPKPTICAT